MFLFLNVEAHQIFYHNMVPLQYFVLDYLSHFIDYGSHDFSDVLICVIWFQVWQYIWVQVYFFVVLDPEW